MTVPAERLATVQPGVVAEAARGDRGAFTELVATYHADMIRLAMVVTGDADLANDAAQAAWHQAWLKLRQLRDPARIRPWLLSIAANEARQALRRRAHLVALPDTMSDSAPPEQDPIDAIDLARALATLRPDDRRLIGLRYVSGFSAPELAEIFGISPEGVRSRLKRILFRLRRELGDD
jgi:RNA polymerase sigma-70 factor (ECF subfamily)